MVVCLFDAMASTIKSVSFEVFGRVQGVFFRKHTDATAKKLGLVGYVMNTSNGTVVGTIEGSSDKVEQMKRWLQEKGSPESRIDKCTFSDEKSVTRRNGSRLKAVQSPELTGVSLKERRLFPRLLRLLF